MVPVGSEAETAREMRLDLPPWFISCHFFFGCVNQKKFGGLTVSHGGVPWDITRDID